MSEDRSMLTLKELSDELRRAAPSGPEDVTVLLDGRRLDSKEKVLAWIAEVESDRAAGRSALDSLP